MTRQSMTVGEGPATHSGHFIGLDIGGSKTHGIKVIDGVVIDDLIAGSANVQNVSHETAQRNLTGLLARLGAVDAQSVLVGSGGVDTTEDEEQLRSLIAAYAPDSLITVVHDTRLILAAGKLDTGVAVIAGTGSATWGINTTGAEARAGGWGYLLGDEGSGYWFGREAVRHSLHRADLGLAVDELTATLLNACGLSTTTQLISHFHGHTDRRYWADKSFVVFTAAEKGHVHSTNLILRGGKHLAEAATQVAARLEINGPVILGGGLGDHQHALRKAFAMELESKGITDVRGLATKPVYGTLHLANRTQQHDRPHASLQ